MALLETVHLSHLPQNTPVHIALYRDIKNASFLREQLISGNTDFQYAFIDASVVRLIFELPPNLFLTSGRSNSVTGLVTATCLCCCFQSCA